MKISVEQLWIIYALTFLILGLLFVSFGSSNPVYLALLAAFLAAFLVFTLSMAYIDPLTLSDNDKMSLNLLYLICGGLVIILLIWSLFSKKNNSLKENKDETLLKIECDENNKCKVVSISNIKSDKEGVHITTIENENELEKEIYSPIGKMKIKYLV